MAGKKSSTKRHLTNAALAKFLANYRSLRETPDDESE